MNWQLTDDQLKIQGRARDLAREVIGPRAAAVDEAEQYPWENVAALTESGFTGMGVPAEYGGPGHSLLDSVLVVEEMAKVCGVTGRIAVECNMATCPFLFLIKAKTLSSTSCFQYSFETQLYISS